MLLYTDKWPDLSCRQHRDNTQDLYDLFEWSKTGCKVRIWRETVAKSQSPLTEMFQMQTMGSGTCCTSEPRSLGF